MELIKTNEACKTKVEYLMNKISNLVNDRTHTPINNDLQLGSVTQSEGQMIYGGDQWTNADTRQLTMRSDELKTGLQEPQMITYRDNINQLQTMDENRQRHSSHQRQAESLGGHVQVTGLQQFNTVDDRRMV